MGAEMDCCDSTDEGRRFYVELKTSREVGIFLIRIFMFLWPCSSLPTLALWLKSLSLVLLQLDYHTEERFEREKLLKFWVNDLLILLIFSVSLLTGMLLGYLDVIRIIWNACTVSTYFYYLFVFGTLFSWFIGLICNLLQISRPIPWNRWPFMR